MLCIHYMLSVTTLSAVAAWYFSFLSFYRKERYQASKKILNKQKTTEWLDFHQLNYPERVTKAELLEIAFENAPQKKYVVDKTAKVYNVDIVR